MNRLTTFDRTGARRPIPRRRRRDVPGVVYALAGVALVVTTASASVHAGDAARAILGAAMFAVVVIAARHNRKEAGR